MDNDIFITNAEKQIEQLITTLNDSTPLTCTTCKGLWMSGGLDENNSITITYNKGDKCKNCNK